MSFDDDWMKPVFPTRTGGAVGHSLENKMLGTVGGANAIRTRVQTLSDGSVVMLRTRGGFPEFTTISTPTQTPLPEGYFYVFFGLTYAYVQVAQEYEQKKTEKSKLVEVISHDGVRTSWFNTVPSLTNATMAKSGELFYVGETPCVRLWYGTMAEAPSMYYTTLPALLSQDKKIAYVGNWFHGRVKLDAGVAKVLDAEGNVIFSSTQPITNMVGAYTSLVEIKHAGVTTPSTAPQGALLKPWAIVFGSGATYDLVTGAALQGRRPYLGGDGSMFWLQVTSLDMGTPGSEMTWTLTVKANDGKNPAQGVAIAPVSLTFLAPYTSDIEYGSNTDFSPDGSKIYVRVTFRNTLNVSTWRMIPDLDQTAAVFEIAVIGGTKTELPHLVANQLYTFVPPSTTTTESTGPHFGGFSGEWAGAIERSVPFDFYYSDTQTARVVHTTTPIYRHDRRQEQVALCTYGDDNELRLIVAKKSHITEFPQRSYSTDASDKSMTVTVVGTGYNSDGVATSLGISTNYAEWSSTTTNTTTNTDVHTLAFVGVGGGLIAEFTYTSTGESSVTTVTRSTLYSGPPHYREMGWAPVWELQTSTGSATGEALPTSDVFTFRAKTNNALKITVRSLDAATYSATYSLFLITPYAVSILDHVLATELSGWSEGVWGEYVRFNPKTYEVTHEESENWI